jgi:hypothetical protein
MIMYNWKICNTRFQNWFWVEPTHDVHMLWVDVDFLALPKLGHLTEPKKLGTEVLRAQSQKPSVF